MGQAMQHLDECARCRQLVAFGASSGAARNNALLEPGTILSHYVVLDVLGAGAMGVVYSARDLELGRTVALKLLRGDAEHGGERLLREAKAAAALSHPNVVVLHEVGTFKGRVFIAMERVEGGSLTQWLASVRREPEEIVAVFRQAAEGLAAAHEAGIVHRDFKPDNVLMGRDGRARVADFGVACTSNEVAPSWAVSLDSWAATSSLTPTGAAVGTPAYMAPELFAGGAADHRSDQFAFAVSLFQGLYGRRPFAISAGLERTVRVPARAVTRQVRAILQRALARNPSSRFPNMRALLRAIDAATSREVASNARILTTFATAFLPLVVATAGAATAGSLREAKAATGTDRAEVTTQYCSAAKERIDGAWNGERRDSVRQAMIASGLPYAEDTFRRTASLLDDHAQAWSRAASALCRGGPEPEAIAERRTQCFDERLVELQALVGALEHAGPTAVEHAVTAARALPGVEECLGGEPLASRPLPEDVGLRARVIALEQDLRVIDTLRALGQFDHALTRAAGSLVQVDAVGFAPLTAEALLVTGDAQVAQGGDLAGADAMLRRATLAAEGAGIPQTTAEAWIHWAALASDRADYATADDRFDFATAWVDRLGDAGALRGELLLRRGRRLLDGGDYEQASRLLEEALALLQATGSDLASDALKDLGIVADLTQRHDEARSLYERALARYEELLGPDHPAVGKVLSNLGLMTVDDGRVAEGAALLERTLAIHRAALGSEHPDTIEATCNLAMAYDSMHREKEALALAKPAVAAAEKAYGPDNPKVGFCLSPVAIALLLLHRPAEAIEPASRELRLRSKPAVAPIHLADARADVGLALVESRRDVARGRTLLLQARETYLALRQTSRVVGIERSLAMTSAFAAAPWGPRPTSLAR
jgi:tetratricopeptide (TPR) repeat protein/predicted Ser/Thr protein kinase